MVLIASFFRLHFKVIYNYTPRHRYGEEFGVKCLVQGDIRWPGMELPFLWLKDRRANNWTTVTPSFKASSIQHHVHLVTSVHRLQKDQDGDGRNPKVRRPKRRTQGSKTAVCKLMMTSHYVHFLCLWFSWIKYKDVKNCTTKNGGVLFQVGR